MHLDAFLAVDFLDHQSSVTDRFQPERSLVSIFDLFLDHRNRHSRLRVVNHSC